MIVRIALIVSVLVVFAGVYCIFAGCGNGDGSPEAARAARTTPPIRFFSPHSIWNRRVDQGAKINSNSAAMVARLAERVAAEERDGTGPWISTTSYSVPVYTVSASQPTVRARLTSPFSVPMLQSAWRAVPLPTNAMPASGSDAQLVVWQPSTHRLWEFWRLSHTAAGWQAAWGGAIKNIWKSNGVYGPSAWPGATSSWGASASSLSIAGGLIRFGDLKAGRIEHAVAISLPEIRAGVYASPARRTDGNSKDPLSLPEGAHLRLDPKLDLAKRKMPWMTRMIARAAQRYGIVVRDRAGDITFYGQDPVTTGGEPYEGKNGYFHDQYPSELLSTFPWRHLQVLKMDLHHKS